MVNIIIVHFKNPIDLTPDQIDAYFKKYYIPTGILELCGIQNEKKKYSFETMITYEFATRVVLLLKNVIKEKIDKLYFNNQNIPIEFL